MYGRRFLKSQKLHEAVNVEPRLLQDMGQGRAFHWPMCWDSDL